MSIRAIALYLPQYHPIAENNMWWGPGFTEWTNAARARPLFRGHYQPHIPADLGYYDLRLEETRIEQASLAKKYGIHAFCYYHYWFGGGRRLLERPFNEVLSSGRPDFPFCLAWANETWSDVWHGLKDRRILVEQTYPGDDDHRQHFEALLPAFTDPRYVRVDDKPLFMIYRPSGLTESKRTLDLWRDMAVRAGLPGLYLVCQHHDPLFDTVANGYDRVVHVPLLPKRREWAPWSRPVHKVAGKIQEFLNRPTVIQYSDLLEKVAPIPMRPGQSYMPTVIPNWDNTPRSQGRGLVLHDSTPEKFATQLRKAFARVAAQPEEERIVFLKSWNEWAEGNHLEPDIQYGHAYLKAFQGELKKLSFMPF